MCVLNTCSKHRGVHLFFLNKYTTCMYMKCKHMKMDNETWAARGSLPCPPSTRSAKILADSVDIAECPGVKSGA